MDSVMPEKPEHWRAALFVFIRWLKIDQGGDKTTLRDHIERWYAKARDRDRIVVPFSDAMSEAATSWDRAQYSVLHNPVDAAIARAKAEGDFPPTPMKLGYDEPDVALIFRVCFWLTAEQRGQEFFLPCLNFGKRIGLPPTRVWRILRMMEADGVIILRKRGNAKRATRYEWIGA